MTQRVLLLLLSNIKITMQHRRHNSLMTQLHGLNTTLRITPTHHNRTLNQTIIQHLIPTNKLTPTSLHNIRNPLSKILLQLILILQTITLHKLLIRSRLLPPLLRTLVCPNMNILRRKEIHQLIEDIRQKGKNLLRRSQNIILTIIDSPSNSNLFRNFRRSAKLRIGSQNSHRVARNINFGNNSNISISSISNNLPYLLKSIITTITS